MLYISRFCDDCINLHALSRPFDFIRTSVTHIVKKNRTCFLRNAQGNERVQITDKIGKVLDLDEKLDIRKAYKQFRVKVLKEIE